MSASLSPWFANVMSSPSPASRGSPLSAAMSSSDASRLCGARSVGMVPAQSARLT